MNKTNRKNFFISAILLLAFILWTFFLKIIDVQQIGPNNSGVGFAGLNQFIHGLFGVNLELYNITDWLGLVPIFTALGFAILGAFQWIKRKNILKVDTSLIILGGFYIIVVFLYFFFESNVINYRPILINGYLEASYPSSTTLLVLCVMPTAILQLNSRIKSSLIRKIVSVLIVCFIVFMVVGRLVSGVHWFSDIIGGILLSSGLVMLYKSLLN